jgi:hypothetical protein
MERNYQPKCPISKTLSLKNRTKRNTLMQITGASLAYGMIRETVANLTARGPHGTYLLPSVSFLETQRKLAKK